MLFLANFKDLRPSRYFFNKMIVSVCIFENAHCTIHNRPCACYVYSSLEFNRSDVRRVEHSQIIQKLLLWLDIHSQIALTLALFVRSFPTPPALVTLTLSTTTSIPISAQPHIACPPATPLVVGILGILDCSPSIYRYTSVIRTPDTGNRHHAGRPHLHSAIFQSHHSHHKGRYGRKSISAFAGQDPSRHTHTRSHAPAHGDRCACSPGGGGVYCIATSRDLSQHCCANSTSA
jgi:hypothetical protein